MSESTRLLDPRFLRELEILGRHLELTATARGSGDLPGRRHGSSAEFSDHRPYVPGDDPQRIDWAAYARSGETVVKRFRAEEDVLVRIVLDVTTSMQTGSDAKFALAQRVAAALSYVVLARGLRLQLFAAGEKSAGPGRIRKATIRRGRGQVGRTLHEIETLEGGGTGTLSECIETLLIHARTSGWLVVISDLLDARDLTELLGRAAVRGHEVSLCQIHDPIDLSPALEGDLCLVDCETGDEIDVTVDDDVIASLRQVWQSRSNAFREWGKGHKAGYTVATPDLTLTDIVKALLKRGSA